MNAIDIPKEHEDMASLYCLTGFVSKDECRQTLRCVSIENEEDASHSIWTACDGRRLATFKGPRVAPGLYEVVIRLKKRLVLIDWGHDYNYPNWRQIMRDTDEMTAFDEVYCAESIGSLNRVSVLLAQCGLLGIVLSERLVLLPDGGVLSVFVTDSHGPVVLKSADERLTLLIMPLRVNFNDALRSEALRRLTKEDQNEESS